MASTDISQTSELEQSIRLPVADAAKRLGLSPGAVRSRIHRGTIDGFKDENGRLFAVIPADTAPGDPAAAVPQIEQTPETSAEPVAAVSEPATGSPPDVSPLDALIKELHALNERLKTRDAATDELFNICEEYRQSGDAALARIDDLAERVDTLARNIRTLNAAARVHTQEMDRVIRALARLSGNSAATGSLFSPPPAGKPRTFGRRHDDGTDPFGDSSDSD